MKVIRKVTLSKAGIGGSIGVLMAIGTIAGALRVAAEAGSSAATRRPLVVLDAPSNLGLRPPAPGREPGASKLAAALRGRDLLARLGAADAGSVAPPAYRHEPDPSSWFRNGAALAEYSPRLGDRVAALVGEGKFVLLLGGDCSVLVGSMLGLRSLGRYGLLFVDGHDDFSPIRAIEEYRGRVTAAGIDLGIVTGHAPGDLGNLRGLSPYVREENAVAFGYEHPPGVERDYATERIAATAIHRFDVGAIRAAGAEGAARAALARLDSKLAGIWIHVDADVLAEAVMPAVDSPSPRGLSIAELEAALRVFLADPRAVGLELTIYDPDRDPDGRAGDRLADLLVAVIDPPAGPGSAFPSR